MLGPFEQRPLIQLAWCAVMYAAILGLAGVPGFVLAGAVLILLPASAAVLGTGQGILRSLNPVTLWRTMVGLGPLYPAILALIVAAGLVLTGLQRADAWNVLSFAVGELSVLTVFSAIGGALFERRLELGHEPINSPEWRARRDDREHQRALGVMLDELYTQTRLKRRESALKVLQRWLDEANEGRLLPDAHMILDRVAAWRDPIALAGFGRLLTSELMRCGDADGAKDINQRLASLTE